MIWSEAFREPVSLVTFLLKMTERRTQDAFGLVPDSCSGRNEDIVDLQSHAPWNLVQVAREPLLAVGVCAGP